VLPLAASAAAIPFLGPIIPNEQITVNGVVTNQNVCAAGWGMLITVINNIIRLLITLAIVFVAPLMIAWSGFLFVVNPVNAAGKEQAKKILTNTVVGIVIALAGWLIVDAIMAVLYNPTTVGQTWSQLVTSGGAPLCIPLAGSLAPVGPPPPVGVEVACSIPPLSPLTDPIAQQMEGGQTVIWSNTDSRLQTCANKFISAAGGGSVTSAYRPQAYQTHLFEIRDRWCTQGLQSNSNPACNSLKSTVSAEVSKHGLSACGAVAQANSTHSSGTGVDISLASGNYSGSTQLATQACLAWANYPGDPYHYNLISGCSCQ
jgi:hypothetical protein